MRVSEGGTDVLNGLHINQSTTFVPCSYLRLGPLVLFPLTVLAQNTSLLTRTFSYRSSDSTLKIAVTVYFILFSLSMLSTVPSNLLIHSYGADS